MNAAGLLVLRLAVAAVLAAHGGHQMFGWFADPSVGPGGLTTTGARLSALGLEPGYAVAVIAATIQLMAGALIAAGLLTRWAAIAAALYLGILIWKDQLQWGFFANWTLAAGRGHGLEISFVLAGALLCLALAGAGDWSIDGRRVRAAAARASGRARLRKA